MAETMMKLRAEISKRRPEFPRNKSGHRMKLRNSTWRKPKGKHTKLRLHEGSRLPIVKDGFRGPVVTRGLYKTGLPIAMVYTMQDLLKLKSSEHVAIIANVGQRKKYDLVKKAVEMNISLVNIPSVQKFLDKIEKAIKVRKHLRSEYVKNRTKKTETKKEEKKQEKMEAKTEVKEDKKPIATKKETEEIKSNLEVEPKATEKSRSEILKEQQAKADLSKLKEDKK